MAGSTKRPSESDGQPGNDNTSRELTIIEAIQKIAHENAFADIDNDRQLTLFLKSWWSRTYNRPLKDPLLESYTVEELLYEYYDRQERELREVTQVEQDTDRIETKKVQENLDWAEEEERKELEALRKAQETQATKEKKPEEEPASPIDDPANQAWMQKIVDEEIAKGKELFGPDFGEDIEEGF